MTTKKELAKRIEMLQSVVMDIAMVIKDNSDTYKEMVDIIADIVNDVQIIERSEVLQNTLNGCFDEEIQDIAKQNKKNESNIDDIDKYLSELNKRIEKLEKTKKK